VVLSPFCDWRTVSEGRNRVSVLGLQLVPLRTLALAVLVGLPLPLARSLGLLYRVRRA
jgi:hypothetical protein